MIIHNFLVYCRNETLKCIRKDLHDDLAGNVETIGDNGFIPGVILNDNCRPQGRMSNDEKHRRLKGMELRDGLCMKIVDHNMVHQKKDWKIDEHNHAVR